VQRLPSPRIIFTSPLVSLVAEQLDSSSCLLLPSKLVRLMAQKYRSYHDVRQRARMEIRVGVIENLKDFNMQRVRKLLLNGNKLF
jgi:hypothetical protein